MKKPTNTPHWRCFLCSIKSGLTQKVHSTAAVIMIVVFLHMSEGGGAGLLTSI